MSETEVLGDGAPAAVEALPADPQRDAVPPGSPLGRRDRWFPYLAFGAVAGVVVVLSILAHTHLTRLHPFHRQLQGNRWVDAFGWWDGWWYVGIARRGYRFFRPNRQSPVAFFPAYPMAMRFLGWVVGGPLVAGFLLTVACGLGVAVLFHRWCVAKIGPAKARLAVLLLLVYPFAFYLMGAVYADALFIVASLAAFLALERDRPVLAGLAGIVATASRPVGAALVLGLWVLYLERQGVLRGRGSPVVLGRRRRLRLADAGLLLAPLGLAAFCGFLWLRFGDAFAFFDVAGAPGWDQPPGAHTWFKVHWVKAMWNGPWTDGHFGHLAVNAVATIVTVAFIPAVFRRLGWGYGVYVTIAVVATAAATKDFVGMGRYSLAAFPCFAVAADLLFRRPKLARAVLGLSGVGLVILTQLHARGTIVS
ncbi:MAG: mannosyltransferase family protein [Acidimicrobiales bacterium]